jgi:hypothetical protein
VDFQQFGRQNRPDEPEPQFIRLGDRIFVQCEGGPCLSRLERFPPQLQIEEQGGTYVLIDEGEPQDWRYLFVPNTY